MKIRTTTRSSLLTDSPRSLLVPTVAWAVLATLASPAHAELTSQFQGKIEVDAEFADGVDGPTDIAFAADGRAVITRKTGQVVIRRPDGTRNMLTNVFGTVSSISEQGLLGVVADPGVATNNTFYFYVSNGGTDDNRHQVVKAVLTAEDTLTVDSTPVISASRNNGPGLKSSPMGGGSFANHNGGGLFIHKNQLYVGVGDTGYNATPPVNKFGSCLNHANGKILRVNLDGSIPDDNPLVGKTDVTSCDTAKGSYATGKADGRIFAWGFRNPWRLWIDPETDLMWIGDVGESTREEISVGKGGQNFGWPFFEGTTDFRSKGSLNMDCMKMTPSTECTGPVHDYDYNEGSKGASVTGGLIPAGCGWDEALGGAHYLFADYDKNWIRALAVNDQRNGVTGKAIDFDVAKSGNPGPVSFRMGPDDSMYVVNYGADAVYRYTPTDRAGCEPNGGTGGSGGGGAGGASAGGPSKGGSANGGTPAAGGANGGSPPTGGATSPSAGTPGTTGGVAAVTGGRTGSPDGGVAGAGGTSAAGGARTGGGPPTAGGGSPPPGDGSSGSDDGGCGCRVGPSQGNVAVLGLAAAAVAAGVWRRRRRRDT